MDSYIASLIRRGRALQQQKPEEPRVEVIPFKAGMRKPCEGSGKPLQKSLGLADGTTRYTLRGRSFLLVTKTLEPAQLERLEIERLLAEREVRLAPKAKGLGR